MTRLFGVNRFNLQCELFFRLFKSVKMQDKTKLQDNKGNMEVKVEMKQRVKAVARRIVAFLLVAAMTVMLFPKITGSMTVSAAESASAVKNKDNTCLGTSGIAGPKDPRTDEDTAGASSPWSGSYVYFGQNNGRPIRFRVLAPKTTTYGGSTLF